MRQSQEILAARIKLGCSSAFVDGKRGFRYERSLVLIIAQRIMSCFKYPTLTILWCHGYLSETMSDNCGNSIQLHYSITPAIGLGTENSKDLIFYILLLIIVA